MCYGRHVHVGTYAIAGEVQDHKQQDQDDEDDHKHFHPAGCSGGRSPVGPHAGAAVRGRGRHVRALLCRASEY